MTRDERTCAERSRSSRINRHPYQRNHKHTKAAETVLKASPSTVLKASLEAPHEPRAALRGDPPVLSGLVPSAVEAVEAGFIYPDEPPCRIEQPEPCDIPASYRRTR